MATAAPTLTIAELGDVHDLELGASDWVEITQDQVSQFAEATGDRQWIHVDPERAASVPVGSRVRARATLLDSEPKAGGMLNRIAVQVEVEGQEKPAMVGEVLFLAFGSPDA